MASDLFYSITPDIVITSAERAGFKPTGHCMTLNSYENRVYDLKMENGQHFVLKFYRPNRWSKEQILEEHEFLYELQDNEIPVCAPIKFQDNTSIKEIEGIFYAIWPRTGGRSSAEFSDTDLEILGRYVARIHNTGASKKSSARIQLNESTYGSNPLDFIIQNNFLPIHLEKRYTTAANELMDIYKKLKEGIPVHRIHGDCHPGNLLNGTEGWFFLDFDDFLTGPAVQDCWMLFSDRDVEGIRQRRIFIDAYRQFREFDEKWFSLVEPLRALRYIHYSGWVAKRWSDPAFKTAFSWFGNDDYWERETIDLEKQLQYIYDNTEILSGCTKEPEKELTNKDFFWDME
ncbi:serine/threonine protein kinase [Myxococcota bacterium]|nr:serine/threonine protein kinase [Myxococcota bacterium]MBU1380305.1 serine/threonine protein kinase [Myxococcota bacterium]MBU1495293.1 serine/threonine protein kinase [Myxococcota bacterium]